MTLELVYTTPSMGDGKTQTRKQYANIRYRDTTTIRGRKTYYIQPDDVGLRGIWGCIKDRKDGEVICFDDTLGRVLEQDVGKKMQKVKGFWYVESQEQFEERTRR